MSYAKITYEKDKKIIDNNNNLQKLKSITETLYLNNIYNNLNNMDSFNLYFNNLYNDLIKKKLYFYKLRKFLKKNNLIYELNDINIQIKNIKKNIKKYYKLLNL